MSAADWTPLIALSIFVMLFAGFFSPTALVCGGVSGYFARGVSGLLFGAVLTVVVVYTEIVLMYRIVAREVAVGIAEHVNAPSFGQIAIMYVPAALVYSYLGQRIRLRVDRKKELAK